MSTMNAAITAVGGYVPETKLTNFDLEKMVDTNDEWIKSRTGISEYKLLDSISICVNIRFFAISLKINNQNML